MPTALDNTGAVPNQDISNNQGDAMSQMRPLTFDGFEIPYQEITIDGGGDDFEHKYPHTAGAAIEKLGRKLYVITVKSQFDEGFVDEKYAALYPGRLNTLLQVFERQDTATLVLPNRGEIQAFCTNWTTKLTARIRSGEAVDLKFKEDRNEDIVADQGIVLQRRSLKDQADSFASLSEDLAPRYSVFDAITNAVNSVLGYLDQANLYGSLIAAKIEDLTRLLRTADETVSELNDPLNHDILDALHRLWETVLDVSDDLLNVGGDLLGYVVPRDMTITEVAIAIYQDASRTSDLMGLNVIEDPLLIPAATVIKYYA